MLDSEQWMWQSPMKSCMNSREKGAKKVRVAELQGKFKHAGHWHVTCPICGRPVRVKTANLDHIIPLSKGGHQTALENLQLTHKECNSGKGGRMMDELEAVEGVTRRTGLYACEVPVLRHDDNLGYTPSTSLLS